MMFDGYTSHYCYSNPSFSSTLLDSIYRSFDLGEEQMGIYREPIAKSVKKGSVDALGGGGLFRSDEEMANFERVCMIEKLMEKRAGDKGVARRKLSEVAADFRVKKWKKDFGGSSSLSSSSDSSSGGGDADDLSFPVAPFRRPKPIRTGNYGHEKEKSRKNREDFEVDRRERRGNFVEHLEPKTNKHEGGFLKTKSRALKIYGDLKKVKQPISPGGKLASFLNSLFTTAAGSSKKAKSASNLHHSPPSKSANTSTCSSASSFSRSCLSQPPPPAGKFPSVAKRSVKFFPVGAVVDEDYQPCGQKSLDQENKGTNRTLYSELSKGNNGVNGVRSAIDEELMVHVMEYNRRVEDAAMDFLRKTHFTNRAYDREFEEEDEDDDIESCASSDLFELDNLSAIGVERYRKELPVYETTCVDVNRVIVN